MPQALSPSFANGSSTDLTEPMDDFTADYIINEFAVKDDAADNDDDDGESFGASDAMKMESDDESEINDSMFSPMSKNFEILDRRHALLKNLKILIFQYQSLRTLLPWRPKVSLVRVLPLYEFYLRENLDLK